MRLQMGFNKSCYHHHDEIQEKLENIFYLGLLSSTRPRSASAACCKDRRYLRYHVLFKLLYIRLPYSPYFTLSTLVIEESKMPLEQGKLVSYLTCTL